MAKPETRLLTLPPAANSGTWDWDIVDGTLRADASFCELYALDPEALAQGVPAAAFFAAIHPDDLPRIRIGIAGIMAGAEIFSKEYRVVRPDGTIVWVHARGQCHHDALDRPVRFTGLLIDITERKRADERLRVAQSAGGVGTFEYVDGYATVAVSEEFCRLLGFHPTSVLPLQTINAVIQGGTGALIPHSGEAADFVEAMFRIVRVGDGEERWIKRRGEMRKEGSGFRLIGVIYDITTSKHQEVQLRELNDTLEARVSEEVASRRLAEEALRQSQKMEAIGQLTGGIAHDFNNLLMAISSSLALLRKRIPDDPQLHRLIDHALQGTDRGAALTQRMLAFARRQDLRPEPLDARSLVEGMAGLVAHTLGPSWPFRIAMPQGLPWIVADANQLELAIINLAVNARDAMPGGGEIQLVASDVRIAANEMPGLEPGTYLRLSVVDHGCGMDAETLKRAAEPFFTTKGVGKGTGLGLSMVHGLATQMRGTFTLDSEPARGTTATLWIPTAAPDAIPELRPAAPVVAARPAQSLRILAVDDDALILMNTAALLEDLGHHVIEANSGAQALDYLSERDDFDILITDQAMPGMTGTEVATMAYAIRPHLPMILATGYGEISNDCTAPMVKLGKPFDQDDLTQAIADAIELKKATAA